MRPTVTKKLLFWFLLVTVLPLGISNFINYQNSITLLKQEVTNNLIAMADSKARQIETYIQGKKRDVTALAKTPNIIDAIEKFKVAFKKGVDSEEYRALDKEFRPFLTYFKESFGYYDLFLISVEGDIVFSEKLEDDFGTNLKTGPYNNTILTKVIDMTYNSRETEVSDFNYYPPSKEPATFIAAPVLKDGNIIGALVFQVANKEAYALIQDYTGLGKTGETVIGLKFGNEVVFANPLRHDPQAAFTKKITIGSPDALPVQKAVQGIKDSGLSIDYRGETILAAWQYLPTPRWGMVVKIDAREAFAPAIKLRNWILLTGIIFITAVVFLILLVSQSISNPIKVLQKGAEIIGSGNLDYTVGTDKKDEIGQLSRAFDKMMGRLKERTTELSALNEQLQREVEERTRAEEEIKLNANRLKTLLKLSEMGRATVQEIADFVIEEQLLLTQSTIGFLGFMDDDGKNLQVHSWSKSVMEDCRVIGKPIHFPIEKAGIWGEVVRQKKPLIANNYAAPNPHKKGYPQGHVKLERLMVIPVIDGGKVVLVTAVANKEHNYDPTDHHQLKLLVDNMWAMIQRKNAEDALTQSEKQLKALSSQLLTSQEAERKRIVQELHDSVGQTLSALKYTVEHNLNQMGEEAGKSYVTALKDLIPKIQSAVEEVDRIGKDLRPALLDDLGILPTISWFCREFQKVYSDIQILLKITLQENEVPEQLKVVIYRILQESLNNIAKHSRSDRVHIALDKRDRTLEFSIKDNGRGFDVTHTLSPENQESGLGVISMIKRTELSGGYLTILSDKETGTTIQASWPC
jgi:signal transduction histidine kinase